MGVLTDIDTTLKDSDISLIKKKLFGRLCNSGKDTCFTFTVYELVRSLDLEIDEIEMLLENGVCKEHTSVVEYQLDKINPNEGSDFNFCKAYLSNSRAYDHLSFSIQTALDKSALGCLIIFDLQTQKEYLNYRSEHRSYLDDNGFFRYSFPMSKGYGVCVS